MRFLNRRRGFVLGITLICLAAIPSYIRAFVIVGDSDAPAFVTGDRVLVNLGAYDIRLPYASSQLARVRDPVPGDMIVFRLLDGQLVVKRVIAGPGTRISMQGNHVTIDGTALGYAAVAPHEKAVISRGRLGAVVEIERGNGPEVYISFDRGRGGVGDFEERVVPEGFFFVLGSNRDASMDSRQFGPVARERILGQVIGRVWSAG
ncbi:MAG: signal peptidase I [Candidatus Krumholzibacteria bacterium]|nr:signal peptidase I [Candidatus Krumholzibacteria bacterium]MDH5270999.1 signal peptidase I [Candidatus Krumholzibacteria bacterium]MDH5628043.1 signal peptidase I [Candidatus Krumholzibacteria bacterium]